VPLQDPTRLVASSARIVPGERLDLLVHALAQLPDEVVLDIHGDGPDRGRLDTLAAAYGLGDRLRFRRAGSGYDGDRIVYPSRANAATAPLRPSQSAQTAVVLDPGGRRVPGARTVTTMAELLGHLSPPGAEAASCELDGDLLRDQAVGIVTNLPTPYRLPLFSGVGARLAQAGARFRVFFLAPSDASRPWIHSEAAQFDHDVLRSLELPVRRRHPLLPTNLAEALDRFQPSLLVAAGFSPAVSWRIARYAAPRKIPLGLWSGDIPISRTARSRVRRPLRRRLAHRASFGISYGYLSGEYLHFLRAELPFVYGRNTSMPGPPRGRPRRPATVEIVAVAHPASTAKGIDVLIEALRLVRDLPCRLSVIGGGRGVPSLAGRARADRRIRFLGPLSPADVRAAYEQSDVLAFPTRADVFGLVLVEAMGAGLASVVSTSAGAVFDLAVDRSNALVVHSHDPREWAEALARLVQDHELREALGAEARGTIERRWTMEHSIDAVIAGLRLGALRSRERAVSAGGER
jgi:glycosyltransferase involved in cell wall biosynthesis